MATSMLAESSNSKYFADNAWPKLKKEIQDGGWKIGISNNSTCRIDGKFGNTISMAIPMFAELSNSMTLLWITPGLIGNMKSRIAADEPEVVITQLVEKIATRFQRLYLCCRGSMSAYVGLCILLRTWSVSSRSNKSNIIQIDSGFQEQIDFEFGVKKTLYCNGDVSKIYATYNG